MNSQFDFDKESKGDKVVFRLSGQIDEDAELLKLDFSDAKEIEFNLDNVKLINSCGIRDWVEFQKTIPESVKISYSFCPQIIIEQINIIKGFIRPGAKVESFYAPYYDESKDEEVKLLITPDEVINQKAPVKKNEQGEELEFDEIEVQYFNFLRNNS
ncbi:MAG: hypothetical protein CME65_15040 [Halobacteriovoraceae bacterium]|nr:hypothetical protein [Halobacteriovoraceae bacterium]